MNTRWATALVICSLAMGYMFGRRRTRQGRLSQHYDEKSREKTKVPRVCVVTGGSRGIGAAICERLAADGYSVIVNYNRNKSRADELVERITSKGGRALAIGADVSVEADVVRMFQQATAAFGQVTACVNNAAILGPMTGLLADETRDQLAQVMATNLHGAFFVLREATRCMSTSSGGLGGAIVNISAGSAFTGSPIVYAMSKAALNSLTNGSIQELAQQGIRLNTVSPGPIETEMMNNFSKDDIAGMVRSIPMQRAGDPREIAAGVAWLLSNEASFVAGDNMRIAGGKPLTY